MQCLNTSSGWLNYLRNNVWPVTIITFIFNEITILNKTLPLHHSCFQQIFKLEIPLLQQTIGSNLLEATTICYSSAGFKWKKTNRWVEKALHNVNVGDLGQSRDLPRPLPPALTLFIPHEVKLWERVGEVKFIVMSANIERFHQHLCLLFRESLQCVSFWDC